MTIYPPAANGQGIPSYAKVGFRPAGVMRQYERGSDERSHDGLLMDLLATNWLTTGNGRARKDVRPRRNHDHIVLSSGQA